MDINYSQLRAVLGSGSLMAFDEIYDDFIKDMVDGPRIDEAGYEGPGLPPHENEFKGLLRTHFGLKCFHPMRGGDLRALTDLHKEMQRCAEDPEFAPLNTREFPNRVSYTRLPSGETQPQNLNALVRQQRTFLKLIAADEAGQLEAKPELKRLLTVVSGDRLFKHPDNSVKASVYRLQRDGFKAMARDLGMKQKSFGQAIFGTANGHNTLGRIYDADAQLAITHRRLLELDAALAKLYKSKGKDYDDAESWHITMGNGSIDPLKSDNGNNLN